MANLSSNHITESVQARFWAKVEVRGADECWPWIGCKNKKDGRGWMAVSGRNITAPNLSLRISIGEPESELARFALHKCDNPNCVNPNHLWWGSIRDNGVDASKKGRLYGMAKTHCLRGHEYTVENTATNNGGQGRKCRTCQADHRKRHQDLPANKLAHANRQRLRRARARQALTRKDA